MKKILSMLVVMTMVLSLTAAVAEEVSWTDIEAENADQAAEGAFVPFAADGIKLWIPNTLTAAELTEEETDQGYIACFNSEDGTQSITVVKPSDVSTLDALKAQLETAGAADIKDVTVNGLTAVTYTLADSDASCMAVVSESGSIYEITGTPASDADFAALLTLVTDSVQAVEA